MGRHGELRGRSENRLVESFLVQTSSLALRSCTLYTNLLAYLRNPLTPI